MGNVETVDFRADRGADNSAFFIAEAPRFEGVDFVLHGRALGLGIGGTDSRDTVTLGTAGGAAAVDFAADPGAAGPSYETRSGRRKGLREAADDHRPRQPRRRPRRRHPRPQLDLALRRAAAGLSHRLRRRR